LLFLTPFLGVSSFGHLEQSSSGGAMEGKFFTEIGFEPRNPNQNMPTKILFSIQDKNGDHIRDLQTMVEVYSPDSTKRLFLDSWTIQDTSDFEVLYNFKESGTYQIVLSVSEETELKEHVVPSRTLLSSSQSCNCTRVVFNASVSEDLTNIWNSVMVIVVVLPFSIFGFAMMMNYKNKRNSEQKITKFETLRYIIVLLALAGGMVHLSIYVNHVPLRIEYGIFLLLASITQIGFGVLYLAILLSNTIQTQRQEINQIRNKAIHLFGLIGSFILLGLYIYVVNFIPPLSPENHPEEIDLAGIVAKSFEISLILAIIIIMRHESKILTK